MPAPDFLELIRRLTAGRCPCGVVLSGSSEDVYAVRAPRGAGCLEKVNAPGPLVEACTGAAA